MSKKSPQTCNKCGLCLNVCPVYKAIKEESASPRSRLQFINAHDKDELASSALLKKKISQCLMCGTCSLNCPAGIDHYGKFMEMREKMAADHGEPAAIRSMIFCLAQDNRLKLSTHIARKGQQLLPDGLARSVRIGNIPLGNFPKLNSTPLRKAHDTIILPDKEIVGTVVYFTGCATNYMFDDTGNATIGVLKHMGYKIIIPEDQTCCSIPLLFHGAKDQALKNINANIAALKGHGADAIIVDCSTCGEALKNEYPSFFAGESNPDLNEISSKVMDIITFMDQHFDLLEFKENSSEKYKVTYHAPCHTKNSFGSHLIAESLLEKLPFIDYHRTPDFDECCGGGGTFFYEYPDIAKKIVEKKIANATAIKVRFWVTDCPVCRINLAGNLKEENEMTLIHPMALIHKVLKGES